MAKKQNTRQAQVVRPIQRPAVKAVPELPPIEPVAVKPWTLFDFKVQAIIVALLGFILYANTYNNEYAHDDGIVMVKNEFVLEGFAGLPGIFTRDAYWSYYRQLNTTNQLAGGRFRPLSIATFAIEQQFFGAVPPEKVDSVLKQNISYGVRGPQEEKLVHDMHIRHIISVLWFTLSVVILLYFLRFIVFRREPIMAFIAAIIFTVHPIHTEVVANVKSRDEIMSLLFMCLTFIFAFKYEEKKDRVMLGLALTSYFFAFLSKEYAITLVFLLPASLYIFNNFSIKKSILAFMPYIIVIGVYLAMRYHTMEPVSEGSDSEVLNNPYLFASPTEKLATEIATCLNYVRLQLFPHPLSADYSYNSIPYVDFSAPKVWLSLLVHGGAIVFMLLLFKKIIQLRTSGKPTDIKFIDKLSPMDAGILAFALAFYFIHFALVCNIIFDIGATMGERLIYHSSVGFAIIIAYLFVRGAAKIKPAPVGNWSMGVLMVVIIGLCGFKTIERNKDWKNDATLFGADIKTVPNSVLVSANVAASYITISDLQKNDSLRKDYLERAIVILDHTLSIHHTFVAAFLNRGIAWYKLGNADKAKLNMDTVRSLYPNYPVLPGMYKLISDYYGKNGWETYGKVGRFPEAIAEFKKGLAIDPTNPDLWYNLGGALYSTRQYADALNAWQMTLKYNPNSEQAKQGVQACMQVLQQINGAAQQQKPPKPH